MSGDNSEIPNDVGWGNLLGPNKIKAIQKKYGIPEHTHLNGLLGCSVCINACVFGNKNPLQGVIDALTKELSGKNDKP